MFVCVLQSSTQGWTTLGLSRNTVAQLLTRYGGNFTWSLGNVSNCISLHPRLPSLLSLPLSSILCPSPIFPCPLSSFLCLSPSHPSPCPSPSHPSSVPPPPPPPPILNSPCPSPVFPFPFPLPSFPWPLPSPSHHPRSRKSRCRTSSALWESCV